MQRRAPRRQLPKLHSWYARGTRGRVQLPDRTVTPRTVNRGIGHGHRALPGAELRGEGGSGDIARSRRSGVAEPLGHDRPRIRRCAAAFVEEEERPHWRHCPCARGLARWGLHDAAAWPLEGDARSVRKLPPRSEERVEDRAQRRFSGLAPLRQWRPAKCSASSGVVTFSRIIDLPGFVRLRLKL